MPEPPPDDTYTRASRFNSYEFDDARPLDGAVRELLFARGHCVERFADDALRAGCCLKRGAVCEAGVFVSDERKRLCGTPDAIVWPEGTNGTGVLIEVKDTTRRVDNVLLKWVLQCHVYMIEQGIAQHMGPGVGAFS